MATPRCQRCSFSILSLLVLIVLLPVLHPVSPDVPPGNGGHRSPSDGETPTESNYIPRDEEEPSHVENYLSPSEPKRPTVKGYSTSERETPFVKGSSSATEGRALSVGEESSAIEEESPSVEDDPSSNEEPGSTGDAPTWGALLMFPTLYKIPAIGSGSGEESDNETQDDMFISRTNVVNNSQRVTPSGGKSQQRRSPQVGGSTDTNFRRLEKTSAQKTLELCKSTYRSVYKVKPRNIGFVYTNKRFKFLMFVTEKFVKLCRPLFIAFEKCINVQYLTLCYPAKIGFLHSHGCRRQSQEDKSFEISLAFYLLENETECFEGVCDGSIRLIESKMGGLTYQIFNIIRPNHRRLCTFGFNKARSLLDRSNKTVYLAKNTEWPCCYALYLVAWLGNPEEHGLSGGWSYLPASCRAGEVLLIVMVAAVGVIGVVGNLVVVVVMLSGAHKGQESSLLRTSLALSDLLTGLFVVLPAFSYHLAPFFRPPEYHKLTGRETLSFHHIEKRNTPDAFLSNTLTYKDGFPLFQSLVFGTCSTVSLLTLFLLSAERLVMTSRALRYRHYITKERIKAAIVSTWVLSVLQTLLLYYDRDGNISTSWSTFTKVPKRTAGANPYGLAYAFFSNLYVVIYILAGIATVTFSILAFRNFVRKESRVASEWKEYGMRTTAMYHQENRRILTTMTLMIVFYITSVLPITILIIMNISKYTFIEIHLFGYMSVWLLLASTAWNPWLYNIRSSQFTGDVADLLYKVLPTSLRETLAPCLTHSLRRKEWDQTELTPGRKKMLAKLGLTT